MKLSGIPGRISPDGPQYPTVVLCGPWVWDVRVDGYVVTVQGDLREARLPKEVVLDFAVEQIARYRALAVLES